MHLSFAISVKDKREFLAHWSSKYKYKREERYTDNIGKPLTEASRQELFEWKNNGVISGPKTRSILANYPLVFSDDHRERYLNHKQVGGAIWNIFYLHCVDPKQWPIFDQHTFRAMRYIKTGNIVEIGSTDKQVYQAYVFEYLPFLREYFPREDGRTVDKALFAFGQFLKLAARYA